MLIPTVTLAFCVLLLGSGCSVFPEEQLDVQDQLGTIEQFGTNEGRFVIRPDHDPSIAYVPIQALDPEVRRIGLRVIFSGNIEPFPEDPVHDAAYPPFSVHKIQAAQ